MLTCRNRDRLARCGLLGAGLFLVIRGMLALLGGRASSQNYWGGLVFAPFGMVLGLLLAIIAVFRWGRSFHGGQDRSRAGDRRKW